MLLPTLTGCLDYTEYYVAQTVDNSPPVISTRLVDPQPGPEVVDVKVGTADTVCVPQEVFIPEIVEADTNDTLYFQWFINYDANDLLRRFPVDSGAVSAPPPEAEDRTVRALRPFALDRVKLETVGVLPSDPDTVHLLELYVADRPYEDPRFGTDGEEGSTALDLPADGLEDYLYWHFIILETPDCGGAS
jgi:hypothetical protein